MERLNTSVYCSRILRFVDFDIPTGSTTVMNGGLLKQISLADFYRIDDLCRYRKGHVKKVSENTFVIDRWIYNAINKGEIL